MRILLDTHIWLWYLEGNPKLSDSLSTQLTAPNNQLWLSPVSLWEFLLLIEKGKISIGEPPEVWIRNTLATFEVQEAPLNYEIAILSRQISLPHQDPADRFLAATAIHYDLTLATVDQKLVQAVQIPTIS